MNSETDQSHVSTEDKWDKSNDSDTYVRLLLLFGPPPDCYFDVENPTIVPGMAGLTTGKWEWQKPVQEWLFEHGIITARHDGSWIRAFLCWYREACREQ